MRPLDRAFADFAVAFTQLRRLVDDDAAYVERHGAHDKLLLSHCEKVSGAHNQLKWFESLLPVPMADTIEPASINLRREYEREWQQVVNDVCQWELNEMFAEALRGIRDDEVDLDRRLPAMQRRDELIEEAREEAKSIAIGLGILDDYVENNERDAWWQDPFNSGWTTLTGGCGLDIAAALWRRRWLPFTLIPSYIRGQELLTRRLGDAARAYIFGAPWACVALQRAVLEQVLISHYGAIGDNLDERIASVSRALVDDLLRSRMDWLRTNGNAVLHGVDGEPAADELDLIIYNNFVTLRHIIEQAPRQYKRSRS